MEEKDHVPGKKTFLNNSHNKSKIIQLRGSSLEKENCVVIHSSEDADVDIAVNACKLAREKNITVFGEDSDLLVLLIHYSTI